MRVYIRFSLDFRVLDKTTAKMGTVLREQEKEKEVDSLGLRLMV